MTDQDETLRSHVRASWPQTTSATGQPFDDAWHRAEARHAAAKRARDRLAGVAAAAAIVAVVVMPIARLDNGDPGSPAGFVDPAELLGSTSWAAPSDALLPEYEFDIYQEMPELMESTEPAGGSLL